MRADNKMVYYLDSYFWISGLCMAKKIMGIALWEMEHLYILVQVNYKTVAVKQQRSAG
jgi:hypothetical protein